MLLPLRLRNVLACAVLCVIPVLTSAQESSEEFSTAIVTTVSNTESFGTQSIGQEVILRIESGPEEGKVITLENSAPSGQENALLQSGETVVVSKQTAADGSDLYILREKYRLPNILWLLLGFVVLAVVLGGRTGVTSIAGLAVSVGILVWYVLPGIVAGYDPLLVSLSGSAGIACTSLYLAHGFSKRTSIALLSTLLTLCCAAILAFVFVHAAKLFGMGSEEAVFLQSGLLASVNLQGLLFGGIIIGCLGVLDDITTAQTAAIDEISKANPKLSFAALRAAGTSVGREHIASLINTLALAYAGASLPLLLLFRTQESYPLWVTLNGEFLAEEIIRTLVGSTALLLAVPVSTWLAAWLLQGGKGGKGHWGHTHGVR